MASVCSGLQFRLMHFIKTRYCKTLLKCENFWLILFPVYFVLPCIPHCHSFILVSSASDVFFFFILFVNCQTVMQSFILFWRSRKYFFFSWRKLPFTTSHHGVDNKISTSTCRHTDSPNTHTHNTVRKDINHLFQKKSLSWI